MRRSDIVNVAVTPYYHCMSRCVRRAFLCGKDGYSGQSFEHRRGWVRDRLRFLASVFAIDVCAYAVMSNHLHVVLHVNSAKAEGWSDDELQERYCRLYKSAKRSLAGQSSKGKKLLLALWRKRLADLSWMMRALNEYIARKANKEDEAKGHFWESRFKSQALLDRAALLTCMAYVDLNPIRAGICETIEASDFTSIQDRLQDLAQKRRNRKRLFAPKHLSSMRCQPAPQGAHSLPLDFAEYLKLLKWTADSRAGFDLEGPAPQGLRELAIDHDDWFRAQAEDGLSTGNFVGKSKLLKEQADRRGTRWVRGVGLS